MKSPLVILALLSMLIDTGVEAQVCTSPTAAFSLGVALDSATTWGDSSSCSGHLMDETGGNEPICGFIDHRAAERACWELNAHTDNTLLGETQRRYRCSPYTGSEVDNLVVTNLYYELGGGGAIGQACLDGDPDCFMDCHASAGTANTAYAVGTTCGGSTLQTAIACFNINECTDGIFYDCTGPFQEDCEHRWVACGPNTDCTDTVGSYECVCADGYVDGTPIDPNIGCIDNDECSAGNPCGADSVCENTIGSFVCLCEAGYSWDDTNTPGECEINTCTALLGIPNAVLTHGNNEYGSTSSFDCNPGYEPSIAGSDPFTVQCRDDGTYCHCSTPRCLPIKCSLPRGDPNAWTPVSPEIFGTTLRFTCQNGFEAGGARFYDVTCQDDGQWTTPPNPCADVNECANDPCPTFSICFNTIGSHICVCYPGYEGDDCDAISCGAIPDVANAQITTTVPTADSVFGMVVNYRCEPGYHVSYDQDPNSVVTNFNLECKQDECWSPQPIPQCVPVSCGDPGVPRNAKRSPGNFFFEDVISYTCEEGYRPSDHVANPLTTYRTYTITCEADGMWSPSPHCTDIDECLEISDPCGPGVGHICINQVGTYTCACAAYFRLDQTGQNCIGFPVTPDDVTEPCRIYTSLAMCNYGTCYYHDVLGTPYCSCDEGYTGAFCDRKIMEEEADLTSLPFILSIVSLALAFFALMIAIIVAFCFCCTGFNQGTVVERHDHHVERAPIYQTTPPLGGGYPRAGFMMALRNKATNALYPMAH